MMNIFKNMMNIKNYMNRILRRHVIISSIILITAFSLCGCKDKASDDNTIGNVTISSGDIVVDTSQINDIEISVSSEPGTNEESDNGTAEDNSEIVGSETDATTDATDSAALNSGDSAKSENAGDAVADNGLTTDNITPGATESVSLNPAWTYADYSKISTGQAVLYRAAGNRNNIVIGVNAGHGTKGGQSVKTYCHPDMSPKVTGGTTAAGATTAIAVSGGMSFLDGTPESKVTLATAKALRDKLLSMGYDVLMLRDGDDVQLDNIARTVLANNTAACHIAIHFDGDNLNYDKGCFYISTPDGIKNMEPVASNWTKHEALGAALISGLTTEGCKIYKNGSMSIDLTQTSYSTVPSVDIELGNAASSHDEAALDKLASGLANGINTFFNR